MLLNKKIYKIKITKCLSKIRAKIEEKEKRKKMKRIQCLQQPMKNESFAHYDAHNDDAHKLN